MKQKYTVIKNVENDQLIIKEYAELDRETLSLLCEETFAYSATETAARQGDEALMAAIRTHNFFPPAHYARAIAETVKQLIASDETESAIFFNDLETLKMMEEDLAIDVDDIEDESADIDELLEEDMEDDFDDDIEITNINSSIKIADEDAVDLDEEP